MSNEKIIIKDSCILFDLIDLNLIDPFFHLDIVVHTTSYVLLEVTDEDQRLIVDKYINLNKLSVDYDGVFDEILKISNECPGLSITDCSVLELAARSSGVVLSSDKALRNETERRNLTVRGVLWIIQSLVSDCLITMDFAIEKLNKYLEVNPRAPRKQILILIDKLKSPK